MSTTTQLPPGVYRITTAGDAGTSPTYLTRHEDNRVTILPPTAVPDIEQQWRVVHGRDGDIIIERPDRLFPVSYLTYKGAPKKPEEADQIVYHMAEFHPNEWHVRIAPGFRSILLVAGSELGIKIALPKVYPPILELGTQNQLEWVFERVRD